MQVNLPVTEGNFEVIVLDKLQFCDYKAISPKQTFEYEIWKTISLSSIQKIFEILILYDELLNSVSILFFYVLRYKSTYKISNNCWLIR